MTIGPNLNLKCPHGTSDPKKCSQCLGVVPKRITHDETTGQMLVDGHTTPRHVIPPPAQPPNANKERSAGRRPSQCSRCLKTGHNRAQCQE